ncbi:hypothetical protein GLAREA_05555 [Glarea lozoyensis ATCC 20868]|uniref:Uncharacterized protein n=1 Tax=Glarea lozoyensis (strain ATCC 20868 / MF5171) TaxID=1116229 RepID=S3DCT2_GLAL2|nr:uncharacterized protein GLAREA_05555 [Glarea lozoyensis ATCC 20868]EPE36217.1 hypothetical protein GLAREA_05555 [Glarea lozoyensis ATCC 20868]
MPAKPYKGCFLEQRRDRLNVFIDPGFTVPLRNHGPATTDSLRIGQGGSHKVLEGLDGARSVGEVDTLLRFNLHALLDTKLWQGVEEIGHGKDGLAARERCL